MGSVPTVAREDRSVGSVSFRLRSCDETNVGPPTLPRLSGGTFYLLRAGWTVPYHQYNSQIYTFCLFVFCLFLAGSNSVASAPVDTWDWVTVVYSAFVCIFDCVCLPLPACMFISLFACLPLYLLYVPLCLFVSSSQTFCHYISFSVALRLYFGLCLSLYRSLSLLSVCRFVCIYVCLSLCFSLSVCLSVCVCLFVCLSVCLSWLYISFLLQRSHAMQISKAGHKCTHTHTRRTDLCLGETRCTACTRVGHDSPDPSTIDRLL